MRRQSPDGEPRARRKARFLCPSLAWEGSENMAKPTSLDEPPPGRRGRGKNGGRPADSLSKKKNVGGADSVATPLLDREESPA